MLNVVVATKAEAESLITALHLKHVSATFPLYTKDTTSLVITGIGKCRAAAITSWLAAQSDYASASPGRNKSVCWLNVGIAGHCDAHIGSIFCAHKINDFGSEKVWYPPQISPPLPSANLTTVDKPLDDYIPDQLHDMEGSGFVETARMYSYAELVQCIKVVSDNAEQPFSNIDAKLASHVIAQNIPSIVQFIDHLQTLATNLKPVDISIVSEFLQRWNFSVSQKIILERLLQRYSVLHSPMTAIPADLNQLKSTKEALRWLTHSVDSVSYSL